MMHGRAIAGTIDRPVRSAAPRENLKPVVPGYRAPHDGRLAVGNIASIAGAHIVVQQFRDTIGADVRRLRPVEFLVNSVSNRSLEQVDYWGGSGRWALLLRAERAP